MRLAGRRRNDELRELAAENLPLRVSERALCRTVELENEPAVVDGDHGVERRIENRARVRQISAQRCLGRHRPGVAILDHRLTTIVVSSSPATPRSGYEPRQSLVARRAGKRMTSRIVSVPERSITSRSMPRPRPPVGGMP